VIATFINAGGPLLVPVARCEIRTPRAGGRPPLHLHGRRCAMHDAAVSGVHCARQRNAITQDRAGRVGDDDDRAAAAGRVARVSPVEAL
jgi:hypothetical protein